jgi:chromosome segregation protein
MYLKQLDVIGFKSFADRTKLTFEPGLIAIVGPNGCGKSNVSDAIRWVLGEQRPTALRCSKLVDVVFNGTDTRKPLGLAEVSITFADCEKELGTDYHEVTITRRVYRDGSGEYFLNKQSCRLRDIQHLFMGTGIGTSSYSVMAQGQIDAILSSKPEDRRAVFEEASGITKFKADRKEALRKIEQTEQNLLREADVLREMKRQIASLQRQVGKAQKYKELRDQLRGLDIYVSKQKIHGFDLELEQNAANRLEIEKAIEEATGIVVEAERSQQELHAQVHEIEDRLQTLASQQAAADSAYSRANEVIGVNASRIEEYRQFAERDEREIADTKAQLEELAMQVESLQQKSHLLTESLEATRGALAESEAAFAESQSNIEERRAEIARRRHEAANTTQTGSLVNDTEVSCEGAVEVWKAGTKVSTADRREFLLAEINGSEDELRAVEIAQMTLSQQLTERRIAVSQMEQELSFVGQQNESSRRRRDELQRSIEGRVSGISRYHESIERLKDESGDLLSQLDELKGAAADCRAAMEEERAKRSSMMEKIVEVDREVARKRADLDQARDFRGKLEVQAAEATMRRQNIYDHLQDEYGLFADAVLREADPEWKNGTVPPMEELEGTVGRLQAQIAELGPVNMVAIDECRELEERYAREKAQEEDLLAAKAQILELINNLNMTSSDLFKKTFQQADKNFQTMFTKLFGGGEARLVLLENEEDPLECGIDIIARPPGKRPQSVTLLSGGERTMTAVALLFSIFMIKPAPFCMLDELDAALDDANIGRFVDQLKEFLANSQFLIITHNQHTIAGSDLVYGVSQQEKGVSRVISMKLSDLGVKEKKR